MYGVERLIPKTNRIGRRHWRLSAATEPCAGEGPATGRQDWICRAVLGTNAGQAKQGKAGAHRAADAEFVAEAVTEVIVISWVLTATERATATAVTAREHAPVSDLETEMVPEIESAIAAIAATPSGGRRSPREALVQTECLRLWQHQRLDGQVQKQA